MKTHLVASSMFYLSLVLSCTKAGAACDQLAGAIISTLLKPQIESLECKGAKLVGIDKRDHHLVGVCYDSTEPTSHIRIDANLHCHGSSENVVAKATGDAPSVSENLTVQATMTGGDCHVRDIDVQPSGEIGKLAAQAFNAKGKAREAFQQALSKACGK